jgi:type IV pilus assembly protein PilV
MNTVKKSEAGFTIVEIIIAVMVLTVGILGLVTTAALVTRMIGRGQRSAVAGTFAAQRMERLRINACTVGLRVNGAENLVRGSTVIASNVWRYTAVANVTAGAPTSWRIDLTTTYKTIKNRSRTERSETYVVCP